jgi:hypothetical protein
MNRPSGPCKTASSLSDSIHQQLIMYAIAAVVVISLLAVTTLFAQPPRTAVSAEAARPLSITTSNGQDDYLAAVEPLFPNQNFVGHCNLEAGVMDGYCEGGGSLGVSDQIRS